jgi:DNA (cytosine-5)-methyltransferase 1
MNTINAIDLFCGCGGMTTGLVKSGINVIAGIDIWPTAIESYKNNHEHLAICDDLAILTPDKFKIKYNIQVNIDLLVGSPPCQAFSIAGKRKKDDVRNLLYIEYCKYLDYFKPKVFLMENVIGMLSMKNENGEKMIDIIMDQLGKNYNCIIHKLYASDFEVPQNRRRVIIIGVRKDLNIFPKEIKIVLEKRIAVKTILEDKDNVDKKYFLSDKAIKGIIAKKEKSKLSGKGFGAQFLDLDKPSFTIPSRYWKDGYDALVKYDDKTIRKLTVNELKKIQTFPDSYIFKGSSKDIIIQIGNAVSSRFAYHLGKYIISILQ